MIYNLNTYKTCKHNSIACQKSKIVAVNVLYFRIFKFSNVDTTLPCRFYFVADLENYNFIRFK